MAKISWCVFALAAAVVGTTPAAAQGKGHGNSGGHGHGRHYAVSPSKAVTVTRTVLERQGYTVVRVERIGATEVVYYRRGNNGRGKGKGPLEKMVIRTVKDRVVFEDTPPAILVDIDIKLR